MPIKIAIYASFASWVHQNRAPIIKIFPHLVAGWNPNDYAFVTQKSIPRGLIIYVKNSPNSKTVPSKTLRPFK